MDALPVIIFSHGAGGSSKTYPDLIKHWASHGYICLTPTHGDSISLLTAPEKRNFKSLGEYVSNGGIWKHQIPRTEEVKLILDSFQKIEAAVPTLKSSMDSERVGMGGHSYGAYTTQMIGGLSLVNPLTKQRSTYEDKRPRALLMMSPQGTGGQIDSKSWSAIERPTMVVTGTNDRGRNGQDHTWRLEPWENIPAKTKYLAFIKGANHNFGGASGARYPGSGAPNPDHVYFVKSSTLAFWDSQLREDKTATDFLNSDQAETVTGGELKIQQSLRKEKN